MPRVSVVTGEITRLHEQGLHPDAIVNAANSGLRAGSGVCGAIFAAVGPSDLAHACDAIGGCPTGSAVATPAFRLEAHGVRHVIHAVGPIWHAGGGPTDETAADALLTSTYRSIMEVAEAEGDRRIAIPAISTGIYGFPAERAAAIAVRTVIGFDGTVDEVYLVAFSPADAHVLQQALAAERADPHAPADVGPHPGDSPPCESCGAPQSRAYDTPDGPARLCPACATLHGLGCP